MARLGFGGVVDCFGDESALPFAGGLDSGEECDGGGDIEERDGDLNFVPLNDSVSPEVEGEVVGIGGVCAGVVAGDDKINRLVESDEGIGEFSDAAIGEGHGLDIFVGIPAVAGAHVSGMTEVDEKEVEIFHSGGADGHFDDVVIAIGDVGSGVAIVDGGGIGEADFAQGWDGVEHSHLLVSLGEKIDERGDGSFETVELGAFCTMDIGGDASEEGLLSGEGEVGVDGFDGEAG